MKRRQFNQYVISLAALGTMGAARASQDYPSKPITVVVPFSVGGSTDTVSRLISQHVSKALGQPIVVENRAGGGGAIGWGTVARAAKDGYTLLTVETSFAIAAGLLPNLPFDLRQQFSQITVAASVPHVMVINPNLPAKTVTEFIELAKSKSTPLFYGSGGVGTNTHLGGELLNSSAGIKLTHVPYKGASAVLADLASGQVQVMISSIPTALPLIQSGKLRALMVTDEQRSPALPDVPSAVEAGLKEMTMRFWIGFAAPSGTPDAILDRLNREIVTVVNSPEVKKQLNQQGLDVVGNSRDEARKQILAEMDRWEKLISKAGISAS